MIARFQRKPQSKPNRANWGAVRQTQTGKRGVSETWGPLFGWETKRQPASKAGSPITKPPNGHGTLFFSCSKIETNKHPKYPVWVEGKAGEDAASSSHPLVGWSHTDITLQFLGRNPANPRQTIRTVHRFLDGAVLRETNSTLNHFLCRQQSPAEIERVRAF